MNRQKLSSAFALAAIFLDALPEDAPFPTEIFYHFGDAELSLCWRSPSGFAEIGFSGEPKISWYARIDGDKTFGDQSFDEQNKLIPGSLIAAIMASDVSKG